MVAFRTASGGALPNFTLSARPLLTRRSSFNSEILRHPRLAAPEENLGLRN
jgi:hypothetical protein